MEKIKAVEMVRQIRDTRYTVKTGNISVEDKEECGECQWKHWRAGGCPLEAFRVRDSESIKY
ncbi:MAG TPA: hypothetical protein DCQ37_23580, partial [Desulfobacteraceae bacterium]|nr:hypothetical protein [Desulfobacteraceae bacterium]